jgi:hypothetical protein
MLILGFDCYIALLIIIDGIPWSAALSHPVMLSIFVTNFVNVSCIGLIITESSSDRRSVANPWNDNDPEHLRFVFTKAWIGLTLQSEMAAYLNDVLDFDLEVAGFLCVFPYFALFLSSNGFGRLFDYLQRRDKYDNLLNSCLYWAPVLP